MRKIILIALMLFAPNILAQNFQISENKTFTGIHVYADKASFSYSPAHSDGAGCNGAGAINTVTISWLENDDFKAMYSAALAAYASGKEVGFGVSGCISAYGGDTPKMYRLDVKN